MLSGCCFTFLFKGGTQVFHNNFAGRHSDFAMSHIFEYSFFESVFALIVEMLKNSNENAPGKFLFMLKSRSQTQTQNVFYSL